MDDCGLCKSHACKEEIDDKVETKDVQTTTSLKRYILVLMMVLFYVVLFQIYLLDPHNSLSCLSADSNLYTITYSMHTKINVHVIFIFLFSEI
jgi:hypothetical protein